MFRGHSCVDLIAKFLGPSWAHPMGPHTTSDIGIREHIAEHLLELEHDRPRRHREGRRGGTVDAAKRCGQRDRIQSRLTGRGGPCEAAHQGNEILQLSEKIAPITGDGVGRADLAIVVKFRAVDGGHPETSPTILNGIGRDDARGGGRRVGKCIRSGIDLLSHSISLIR